METLTTPSPGGTGFVLPTAKSPPSRKSPQMMVIYGPPKCGKTTAIAALDGCLCIDVENGTEFLEILKVRCENLKELQSLAQSIRDAGKPYKYIALDTATRLEEWAEAEATRRYKASSIGKTFTGNSVLELPNGGGYLHLRNAFFDMINMVRFLADRVIFVCHLRDKLIGGADAKSNTTVSAKDLELTGKCKQILCSLADAIGYVYRTQGGKGLRINFQSSESVNCGSRCEHLRGQDMDLDWSKIYVD